MPIKFHKLDAHQSRSGLRALVMVAHAAHSGMGQPQQALADAIQHCLLQTHFALEDLSPISASELSTQFQDVAKSRQLIQQMIIISLADGAPSKAQCDLITSFAESLKVNEPAVKITRYLMEGKRLRFRLEFLPRSNVRDYLGIQIRNHGGWFGLIKGLLGFRGLIENKALASTFLALEDLPENTLGHQFFYHYRENSLSFPGERGGFPMGALFHDLGHVLGGYDTTPEGEIQVAAFQAGYRQTDHAFFTMLFALLIHTAGINMAPIAMPIKKGRIGDGNLAEKMFNAWLKGTKTKVDLGADWDFIPYLNLPLDEARQRTGIDSIN